MTDSSPTGTQTHVGTAGWRRRALVWSLTLIAVVLLGWALRALAPVAIPLVFSLFLALLVAPVDKWATERIPGRASWVGHMVAMGVILAVLLLFVGMLWFAAQQLLARFPLAEEAAGTLPNFVQPGGGGGEGQAQDADAETLVSQALRAFGDQLTQWASQQATAIVAAAGATIAGVVLAFFLTLIMLIEAPKWRKKTETLLDRSAREDQLGSLDIITRRLRRYLWVRTLLGVLTALLYVAWLWIFGVDLLIVWGLLAFLLNYVPTLGSLISGVFPIIYAYVQRDLGTALLVGAGILVIEQVMGNYVDPRLQGRQLSISSLVVLVALLFWGWLWGAAGAVLAVPITLSILVVFAHVGPLRPVALLLSDETDMQGLDRVAFEGES